MTNNNIRVTLQVAFRFVLCCQFGMRLVRIRGLMSATQSVGPGSNRANDGRTRPPCWRADPSLRRPGTWILPFEPAIPALSAPSQAQANTRTTPWMAITRAQRLKRVFNIDVATTASQPMRLIRRNIPALPMLRPATAATGHQLVW